jgi:hypothetical protein
VIKSENRCRENKPEKNGKSGKVIATFVDEGEIPHAGYPTRSGLQQPNLSPFSEPTPTMTTFPVEVLERVINQFYVTQNRSPAALGPLSLSFRTANELARKLKFKTATISTYFDLIIYQEMVENAPHLFMHTKTLRVVRLTPGYGGRSVDPHFLKGWVKSFVSNAFPNPYHLRRSWQGPSPFY